MLEYWMIALLGSIVVLGLGVYDYQSSGNAALMQIGAVGFVACMLGLMFSGGPEEGTFLLDVILRKPTEEDYAELYKTGYEAEEIEAERKANNEANRAAALWAMDASPEVYVDYDGRMRDAKTNEVIR